MRRIFMSATVVLALVLPGAPVGAVEPSASAPSRIGVVTLDSEFGDWIGQGQQWTFNDPPDTISATYGIYWQTNGIEVRVDSAEHYFVFWFAAADLAPTTIGRYDEARRLGVWGSLPGVPGIDVTGNYRGCNDTYGWFQIDELQVDNTNVITQLDLTFEQRCEYPDWPALRGTIRVTSNAMPVGTHDVMEGEVYGADCAAAGWAVDPDDPYADVAIRILADGTEVTAGVADLFRQDLVDAGVSPDGYSAFDIGLNGLLAPDVTHEIRAQAQDVTTGTWVDLTLTPKTLTCRADTTPPVIYAPEEYYEEGLTPDGTFIPYFVWAEDEVDGYLEPACSPPSGSIFPIGVTEVTCVATDQAGNSSQATFPVYVKDARWMLEDLQLMLADWGKPFSSMYDKVSAAMRLLLADKVQPACDKLLAFDGEVRAQIGKKLTADEADDLLYRSLRIRTVAGCDLSKGFVTAPSGVTAWWTADWTTTDIIGGMEAVLANDAGYTDGLHGGAFALDGDGDFVEVADTDAIDLGPGDFTIGLWVRFNDTAGEQVLIEKYAERFDETSYGWTLSKVDGNAIIFSAGQSGGMGSPPLALEADTWYWVVVSRTGPDVVLWVNGVGVVGMDVGTADLSNDLPLKIGHRGGPGDTPGSLDESGFFLNGAVDDLQFYVGRGLTYAEIGMLYVANATGQRINR